MANGVVDAYGNPSNYAATLPDWLKPKTGAGGGGGLFDWLRPRPTNPAPTQPAPTTPTLPAPSSGTGQSVATIGGQANTSPWHTGFENLPESRQQAVFNNMATGQYTPEDIEAVANRYRLQGVQARPLQRY